MSEQTGELVEIRRELRRMRWHVDEPELRQAVLAWIRQSHENADADTAEEFVEARLNNLLANWKMYHDPSLQRGEDGFPDGCSDCRHYGSACPVLKDNIETDWRERKLDQAESEQEARRIYERQARDVGCHRIPEILETYDDRYATFVRQGDELLSRVEENIHEDPAAADLDEDAEALEEVDVDLEALADGGEP